MNKSNKNTIIAFLKQDIIKNINLIYFMETNPVTSLERFGDTVLMRGESDHPWVYISAHDLMLYMIKKVRRDGKIPFAQVEGDNTKSMNLVRKFGFQKDRQVHWLELESA